MAEVAGLVLGVIPLLISAIEHYEECFRILGCMREFKQEYRKCRNRVKNFELEYDLTLDKLFLNVVDDQDELERLKLRPDDDEWVEVEAKLKARLLPKIHKAYLETMKDLMEVMDDLGEELGVENVTFQERVATVNAQGKSAYPSQIGKLTSKWSTFKSNVVERSQGRAYYEAQRAKFSQGKRRREDLFDQMEGYMKSLDSLLTKNDDVAKILQRSQPPALLNRGLLEFWRHARNIYILLSLSWSCTCRSHHYADLLLLHRDTADVKFDICFRTDRSIQAYSSSHWVSHRALIAEVKQSSHRPSPSKTSTYKSASTGNSPSYMPKKLGPPMVSALKKASKMQNNSRTVVAASSVSFAGISESVSSSYSSSKKSNAVTSMETQPLAIVDTSNQDLTTIEDLCQAISKHDDSHPCSGLLSGQGVDEEYAMVSPSISQAPNDTASLAILLTNPAKKPNRTQRYSIALAIASSHLQLHSSSWLGRRWGSDDIMFDVVDGNASVTRPYLRTTFKDEISAFSPIPVDETFTTLGIVLLELCFGTTLEESPYRKAYQSPDGTSDPVMDWAAAHKWAESVEGEAGMEYADAVGWCLGVRRVRPNDNSWRQDLQRNVIEPLRTTFLKLSGS